MNVLLKRLYQFDFNNPFFFSTRKEMMWNMPLQELNVHNSRLFSFSQKQSLCHQDAYEKFMPVSAWHHCHLMD